MSDPIDGSDEIAPASERFGSTAEIMAATKERHAAADPTNHEPEEEYFSDEKEIPPASDVSADVETPPAEDVAETEAVEEDAPADEKTDEPEDKSEDESAGKILIDGKEYDADDVKEWQNSHKVASTFDRELTKKESAVAEREQELRGIYEELTSEQTRLEQMKANLEGYEAYLIEQGSLAGDAFSESLAANRQASPAPQKQDQSEKPLTMSDFDRLYEARREADRKQETAANSEQALIRNFETFVDDGLDSAGFEKGTFDWEQARKAASFDFFTAFKNDPQKVLALSESEQRAVVERSTRAMGKRYRAHQLKAKSDSFSKMAGNKAALPATPRVAGSPTPEQSAPARRMTVADSVSKLGSMDAYFDSVKRRARTQLDRLNKKG